MLHYSGDIEAHELGEMAKRYIWLYEKDGEGVCYVNFMDLEKGRVRRIRFEKMLEQWVFVDLVD